MKIRYKGPQSDGVDVVVEGGSIHMSRLTVVDVPSDLAERLLEQGDNFERAPAKKTAAKKKAASKTQLVGESGPELTELAAGTVETPLQPTSNEDAGDGGED